MGIKRFFAVLFAAVGLASAAAGIYIAMNFNQSVPRLLTPPISAQTKVVEMMDAVSGGDYDRASQVMLGNPSLGVDRQAGDKAGQMIWDAFQESITYELVGECYATNDGLAQDVVFSGLDIESVTVNLKSRSQALLEQRVREAENISDIYDENNDYREDFVMEVLYDAVAQALEEDAVVHSAELTIQLRYYEDEWWIVADNVLLDTISGGVLY